MVLSGRSTAVVVGAAVVGSGAVLGTSAAVASVWSDGPVAPLVAVTALLAVLGTMAVVTGLALRLVAPGTLVRGTPGPPSEAADEPATTDAETQAKAEAEAAADAEAERELIDRCRRAATKAIAVGVGLLVLSIPCAWHVADVDEAARPSAPVRWCVADADADGGERRPPHDERESSRGPRPLRPC